MTKDELMLAFRMVAMGRPATPHVEGLVDWLLSLAPAPAPKAEEAPAVVTVDVPEAVAPVEEASPAGEVVPEPAKRGRKKVA